MTSRGRKVLSVTRVTALPKGEPRHRILAQEMERICIDTLHSLFYGYPSMRVPPESRMVVNGFRPGTPLPPCGRGGRAQRGRRGQITATSNRKMLAPSQADDVPRAQGSLSHQVTALPKESQGIVYWHKKWSVSVSIRSIHRFTATPQCACRPKVGWS